MPVEQYAETFGEAEPALHSPPRIEAASSGSNVQHGCDLERTYFDVPKMRSSTSDGYLTTGIAYAWRPHRDTWYSAPLCQINWWIPIYDFQPDNAMAFHPPYWNHCVSNSSSGYNYYQWNKPYRGPSVTKMTKEDPRPLPKATETVQLDPQIRLVCPAGGIVIFSGAQMVDRCVWLGQVLLPVAISIEDGATLSSKASKFQVRGLNWIAHMLGRALLVRC